VASTVSRAGQRQESRQRDSHAPSQDRIYLGNDRLTVIDPATVHTLVARCKTIGSFNLQARIFSPTAPFLSAGTEGCGDMEKVQLLSVNSVTGAVRWRAPARAHTYKTGNIEHWDFVCRVVCRRSTGRERQQPGSAPDRFVVRGRTSLRDRLRDGPAGVGAPRRAGRNLPIASGVLSLWIKETSSTPTTTHRRTTVDFRSQGPVGDGISRQSGRPGGQ